MFFKTYNMKKTFIFILFLLAYTSYAQKLSPNIQFSEHPKTHNVHLTSDGKFLYTCNGGRSNMGKIFKYDLFGNFIDSYEIKLDMRSIMYNPKDKKLYVNCYDKCIYKIVDLQYGAFEKVFCDIYDEEQAGLALSPDGKYFYYMKDGTLTLFSTKTGKAVKTMTGFECGPSYSGNTVVAVSKKNIFTWNAETQIVNVYTLKGVKKASYELSKGDYGFSLSFANGMIFVSKDGNYETGKWFGYKLP